MINFKVRFKNPTFIAQLFIAIISPILSYAGLTASDITTWGTFFGLFTSAFSNPYVIFLIIVSIVGLVTDPTTKGLKDSKRAMEYDIPSE